MLDFAGGTVVHIMLGFAALVPACVLGKRAGSARANADYRTTSPSWHSAPACSGSAGSASTPAQPSAANGIASQAFVNTDIAGSIAMCTWLTITWVRDGKPSLVGALTGAVAGLACITPAAGYVPTWSAFIFGLLAGSGCYFAVRFVKRMNWDDALDVWACHGVGGVLGSILLGVFALKSVNAAGADGLLAGNFSFFGWQVLATVVIAAYAFVATFLILKLINAFGSIRVPDSIELKGLDESELGEAAYNLT